MPRSFLLKRNEEKIFVKGSGRKSMKTKFLSITRYTDKEKEKGTSKYDASSEEEFMKFSDNKMIPKTFKAYRINPYERDVVCKLCDNEHENKHELLSNHHKCLDRKQNFSVDKLLNDHHHHEPITNNDHGVITKKSSVPIMKQSPKIIERMRPRHPAVESSFNYKEALWVDAERNRMFPESFSSPSPYLTSPTHSYRSNETGSANSTGSACNSYKAPPRSKQEFSSPDEYKRFGICTGPCCRSYEHDGVIMRDTHSYSPYEKSNKLVNEENCSCPQCIVNREFLRRGPRNDKRPMSDENYMSMMKRKPLSKRKALLGELEFENQKNSIGVVQPMVSPNFKNNTRKTATTDLLEIPPGPNRSRAVANLLERRRVAELNSSFETLRVLVPTYGNEDRTLSKIKTLKYALTYIGHLMTVLSEFKSNHDFVMDRDMMKLCRKDPLIQKSGDHMKNNRKLF